MLFDIFNDSKRCLYVNRHFDLEVRISHMHSDVSAGCTWAVCNCFIWHVNGRLHSNDRKRGILCVFPTLKINATLDDFAILLHFIKKDNGIEFHSCPKVGETCPMFACHVQLLWHMKLSNIVGVPMWDKYA